MEEIKIRAWNSIRHEIEIPENIAVTDGKVTCFDFILEQYIGMKDISGKPIYEGDIVSKRSFDAENGRPFGDPLIGQVVYMPERLRYGLDVINLHEVGIYPQYDQYKVIGNVHQNPELLEADDD